MNWWTDYQPESKSEWYAVKDLAPGQIHTRKIDRLCWEEVGKDKDRKPCLLLTPDPVCAKKGVILSNERHEQLKAILADVHKPADIQGRRIGITVGTSKVTGQPALVFVAVPQSKDDAPPHLAIEANGEAELEDSDIPF